MTWELLLLAAFVCSAYGQAPSVGTAQTSGANSPIQVGNNNKTVYVQPQPRLTKAQRRKALEQKLSEEREEVLRNLFASDAVDSENRLGDGAITITNNSRTSIILKSSSCKINDLWDEQNERVRRFPAAVQVLNDRLLNKGGDGETLNCLPSELITSAQTVKTLCGDLEWKITYTLPDQPNTEQEKRVRFVKRPGHTRWEQMALSDEPLDCSKLFAQIATPPK